MLFMLLHDSDSPKCFGVGIWQGQHDETLRWGAKLSGILHHAFFRLVSSCGAQFSHEMRCAFVCFCQFLRPEKKIVQAFMA